MAHKRKIDNQSKQRKGTIKIPPNDNKKLQQLQQQKQYQDQFLKLMEEQLNNAVMRLAQIKTCRNRVNIDKDKLKHVTFNFEFVFLEYKKSEDVIDLLNEQIDTYEIRVKQLKQKKQFAKETVDRLSSEISSILGKYPMVFNDG